MSLFRLWQFPCRFVTRSSKSRPTGIRKIHSPDIMEEKTFSLQGNLPSLPVPDLEKTLERYLDSVKPHLPRDEYWRTEESVRNFQHGVGKTLQEALLKKAKNSRNWLEEWWEISAYLDTRTSTAIGNMCSQLPFTDIWPPLADSSLGRAPLILWHNLNYWKLLKNEKIPVDKEKNGQNWCMNQTRSIFNTCVIPGIKRDSIARQFKTVPEGSCSSHIVVLRHGHIYKLDILANDGELLTPPELESQLSYIFSHSEKSGSQSLGALTSLDRTSWAKAREHLMILDLNNQNHLDTIEKSIFALAFDDTEKSSDEETMWSCLCGHPSNRWFDKSLSIICYKNGTFAFNANHAPADGIAMMEMINFVNQNLRKANGMWNGSKAVRKLQPPQELVFHIDPLIESEVERASVDFKKEGDNVVLINRSITCFGKAVSRQLKVHPDTFIQLALQLNYYRLHDRPAATYETATTRRYYHGRTETVRSCTPESTEWSKAMLDPNKSNAARLQLFTKAVDKHNRLMGQAMDGEGCDRHLLGLMLVSLENNIPLHPIYIQPAWTASGGGGNFTLSTSLVGYTPVHGGVAAMVKDGYGTFYRIGNQEFSIVVATYKDSRETNSWLFFSTLEKTIQDMLQLIAKSPSSQL